MRRLDEILQSAIDDLRTDGHPPIHMMDNDTAEIRNGSDTIYVNRHPQAELDGPYWSVWFARKIGVVAKVRP